MKKTRFTESQIVKALKENEAGRKTEDICRELEISRATFNKWKSRYGGLEASDVKQLKELEVENCRLKKMFAKLSEHAQQAWTLVLKPPLLLPKESA